MTRLTPAQHRVARLYATGVPTPEILRRLAIGRRTLYTHLRRVRDALGVRDRRSIAAALPSVVVATAYGRPARVSRFGFHPGETVRIVGGLYAGREAVYEVASSAQQVKVRIGGARIAVTVRYVQRIETARVAA